MTQAGSRLVEGDLRGGDVLLARVLELLQPDLCGREVGLRGLNVLGPGPGRHLIEAVACGVDLRLRRLNILGPSAGTSEFEARPGHLNRHLRGSHVLGTAPRGGLIEAHSRGVDGGGGRGDILRLRPSHNPVEAGPRRCEVCDGTGDICVRLSDLRVERRVVQFGDRLPGRDHLAGLDERLDDAPGHTREDGHLIFWSNRPTVTSDLRDRVTGDLCHRDGDALPGGRTASTASASCTRHPRRRRRPGRHSPPRARRHILSKEDPRKRETLEGRPVARGHWVNSPERTPPRCTAGRG